MILPSQSAARGQRGYIMLTLLLILALIAIAAGIAAPTLAFEMKRDREEEMIHRGVQYTRAIRMFVKKNGRYPSSMDELVSKHFLRRRYKDPITKKDFKLLTIEDVMRAVGQASGTGLGLGAGNAPSQGQDPNAPNANADGSPPAPDAANGPNGSNSANAPNGGLNAQTSSSLGLQNASPNVTGISPQSNPGIPQTNGFSTGPGGQNGQVIGAAIAGVASTSKDPTIREFNHKKHYNEWLFFYQPAYDTGFQIKGPTPLTPPMNSLPNLQGQPQNGLGQPQNGLPGQSPLGIQPQQNAPQPPQPPSQ